MNVEEKIVKIVKDATGIEDFSIDDNLMDDMELSSLEIFTMFSEIEDQFGIKIPTEEIETITCVKDIVALVEKRVK